MIIIISIILPILFIIFNSILFTYTIYEADKNVLFINICVLIGLFFLNVYLSFEYSILVLIFTIFFIA